MKLKFALSAAALSVASVFGGAAPALAEAKVVKQVAPEYPRGAERRELEGSVSLSFDVNDAGKVENVAVTDASIPGVFDAAAIKALSQWKFESGSPDAGINVTINFQL
ncbi:energy transducer TonB [Hirschia baltica]|uniref:Protein TonB n=1 Tax=Hirschia baltica (strain ATCC 49814 / DSM 5838 / IFAM 1418) TaxID=582402 RepID=C6XJ04_HIRBI|nr:energy transducer TonB [Hirschia baltica]ACT59099.1 TonB family protein [Hirschia baltica ATCC 49814]